MMLARVLMLSATLQVAAAAKGALLGAAPDRRATDLPVIVQPAQQTVLQILAAREIRRYLYLRTGHLARLADQLPPDRDAIVIEIDRVGLDQQGFRLRTRPADGRRVLWITGGSDVSALYGAYRFAEHLGVRFYLHGDLIPDQRLDEWSLPDLDERHEPLFDLRGIVPFHDFPEGPDWWNLDDYKAHLSQLVKLRMNFLGLHCYPEGPVGPEPLVWIGLPDDVDAQGRVALAYPSRWASTRGGAWGYAAMKTSEFCAGASLLFAQNVYGPDATRGHRPMPTTPKGAIEVFERAGDLLSGAFAHARSLGVKVCIGTETPLTVPRPVRERLRQRQLAPHDPATVRMLYEGVFKRIARRHPVDYYWLWTPEGWTWSGTTPEQVQATMDDLHLALQALDKVDQPFELATCGWVLGPPGNRRLFDEVLPKHVALSCINRDVGFTPVEPAFATVSGRAQWAIPWLEDDPAMIIPQLWVGRLRRDAADALAYGCNGLMGIHWRTKVLSPNVAALARAAWDQSPWNPDFGKPVEPPEPLTTDVHIGGNTADYADNAIAGTEEPRIYQTCRWNVDGYRIRVPDGIYTVTLKFCEVHYRERGKRVFGIKIQGRQVVSDLDVFARVGANAALNLTFQNVAVENEELVIDFVRQVEYPFIAGIVIEEQTPDSEQRRANGFERRINCGGGALGEYESDLPPINSVPGLRDRPRDLPAGDFYANWALSQFGPQAAEALADLFTRLDGTAAESGPRSANLPRPSDWKRGPGGIRIDRAPWSQRLGRYAFVDEMETLRPRVVGAGNLERFDYWLNTFRYLRAIGELACKRGRLDVIMERIDAEQDQQRRRAIAREQALPVRIELARLWERMMTHQLRVVSTPGEMGTIANLEQHVRRHNAFLSAHDETLARVLGDVLPDRVHPGLEYRGPARIIVPTVRSAVRERESLALKLIVLSRSHVRTVAVRWRPMGQGEFRAVAAEHRGRCVYSAALPPAEGSGLEYYVMAVTDHDGELVWPATAPSLNQTVVVMPSP
jgi:hypothetical protein